MEDKLAAKDLLALAYRHRNLLPKCTVHNYDGMSWTRLDRQGEAPYLSLTAIRALHTAERLGPKHKDFQKAMDIAAHPSVPQLDTWVPVLTSRIWRPGSKEEFTIVLESETPIDINESPERIQRKDFTQYIYYYSSWVTMNDMS